MPFEDALSEQHADVGEKPPPTPPKDVPHQLSNHSHHSDLRHYAGIKREGPPTPPKDEKPELNNTSNGGEKRGKKLAPSPPISSFARGRVDPTM
jgi:hypothetical protein